MILGFKAQITSNSSKERQKRKLYPHDIGDFENREQRFLFKFYNLFLIHVFPVHLMIKFLQNRFKTHKDTFIEEAERGFLDTYIKRLKESDELSSFSDEQLFMIGTDFIFPALTPNPWGVTVFVKYMMHYPSVMQKVQKEIDAVVGRDRLVTLSDRVKLPYTDTTVRSQMQDPNEMLLIKLRNFFEVTVSWKSY